MMFLMEILDMKIRNGFVTNSSSTNFIIISKREITRDFLYKQLNPSNDENFKKEIDDLCDSIIYHLKKEDVNSISNLASEYGGSINKIYERMKSKNCFIYTGELSGEDSAFEYWMACTPFEYKTKDFYMNSLNCLW